MKCNTGDRVEWVSRTDSGWLSVGRHYVGTVSSVIYNPSSFSEFYHIDCEEGVHARNIPEEWVIRIVDSNSNIIKAYDRAMGVI